MRNDGLEVVPNTQPFGAASLATYQILAIVNAEGETTDARIVPDRTKPDVSEPAGANAAEAVALQHGKGRVVIVGEAAALTQVITGDTAKAAGAQRRILARHSRNQRKTTKFANNQFCKKSSRRATILGSSSSSCAF